MSGQPLPAAAKATLKPLLAAAKDAVRNGSASDVAASYAALLAALPTPHRDYDLRALASSAVLQLIDAGAWDEAARFQQVKAEQYGADDPSVLVTDAVITYHLDPAAGQRKLAAALDATGAWAFEAFPDYVKVARGGALPYPGPAVPADATELPTALGERIDELSERGNDALEVEDWGAARSAYEEALELVPEPKRNWEAATWLYASIGDALIGAQQWAEARDNLYFATQAPGGMQNPYIQMRLGEAEFELGHLDAAANALISAYMLDGNRVFADEPAKYLDFLRERGLLDK